MSLFRLFVIVFVIYSQKLTAVTFKHFVKIQNDNIENVLGGMTMVRIACAGYYRDGSHLLRGRITDRRG